MEQGKRRYSEITDNQIRDAANVLFYSEQDLIQYSSEEKRDKAVLNAATILINAGREKVRKACEDRLDILHPGFWARKEELEIAKNIVIRCNNQERSPIEQEVRSQIPSLPITVLRRLLAYQRNAICAENAGLLSKQGVN